MSDRVQDSGHNYLSFSLGEEVFAIDVSMVEVVLEMQPITRVPRSKPHLRGVTNHRGSVVPVIDLKLRFGLGALEINETTRIIVMRLDFDGDQTVVGMLADDVKEVVRLSSSNIGAPPHIGSRIDQSIISGIAQTDSGFVILIDMNEAFKDMGHLKAPIAKPEARLG